MGNWRNIYSRISQPKIFLLFSNTEENQWRLKNQVGVTKCVIVLSASELKYVGGKGKPRESKFLDLSWGRRSNLKAKGEHFFLLLIATAGPHLTLGSLVLKA